ncbi:hypothetical protein JW898_03385 [Candidatus Woesearchaeota archaeon]|nr:hypothetical protein [Candidatus Woesearchaeota archaeon]
MVPISPDVLMAAMGGGALLAFMGAFFVFFLLIAAALYVYTSWALMTIGKKLKYAYPWIAWIPVANIAMILRMGGFHWAWVFLVLIPVFGWIALAVMVIIATWRIYEKRKYPGWLALVPLASVVPIVGGLASIAHLIILGFVAWKDVK